MWENKTEDWETEWKIQRNWESVRENKKTEKKKVRK